MVVRNECPVDILEVLSEAFSVGKLSPGNSMVFQYFDELYALDNWNHKRSITSDDQQHYICEIEVYYEPSGEADIFSRDLRDYRTVISLPN